MRSVVADALEQARPVAEARRQALEAHLGTRPLRILGDHKRVVQVLANLLGNASKYTPEGGQIVLDMAVRGQSVVLRVIDNGIGIGPDLLPRVFDLFTQGERSADRKQGGLGVGLAVVRSLVELHGGEVSAASDGPGQGSVFTVALPLFEGAGELAGAFPAQAPQACAGMRLMVVDDNTDAAQTLSLLLESEGYEVVVENSAAAALRRAAVRAPQVCLLDIGLPGMDGFELAQRLRALPGMATCRLVAITGYGQQSDRNKSLAAGFDHHLVKPVDLAALLALLQGYANG
jgi:CheY-like chemotaxis protein